MEPEIDLSSLSESELTNILSGDVTNTLPNDESPQMEVSKNVYDPNCPEQNSPQTRRQKCLPVSELHKLPYLRQVSKEERRKNIDMVINRIKTVDIVMWEESTNRLNNDKAKLQLYYDKKVKHINKQLDRAKKEKIKLLMKISELLKKVDETL